MRPHAQCSTDHSTFLVANTESKITSTFWHNVLTPHYCCCRYLQETRTPTVWTLMNWVMNLSQGSCGFILWITRMICVLEWSCTAVKTVKVFCIIILVVSEPMPPGIRAWDVITLSQVLWASIRSYEQSRGQTYPYYPPPSLTQVPYSTLINGYVPLQRVGFFICNSEIEHQNLGLCLGKCGWFHTN